MHLLCINKSLSSGALKSPDHIVSRLDSILFFHVQLIILYLIVFMRIDKDEINLLSQSVFILFSDSKSGYV